MRGGSRPGERRGGRKKGTPNKAASIRAAFEQAFAALQKDEKKPHHLRAWAEANPTEFYKLAARLIPTEITGAGGGPLIVQSVNYANDQTTT